MIRWLIGLFAWTCLALANAAHATAEWSAQTHRLFVGDFNDDNIDDLMVIAKDSTRQSGLILMDGGAPDSTSVQQTWSSNFLGIDWSGSRYNIFTGSFNEPKSVSGLCGFTNYYYDDVLLLNTASGAHHVLFTDHSSTQLTAIARSFTDPNIGQDWGADTHQALVGQFTKGPGAPNDEYDDVFFQPNAPGGEIAFVVSETAGVFEDPDRRGPTYPADTHLGFAWSQDKAIVHVGDFNGDGLDDLLVQGTTPGGASDPGQYGIATVSSTLSTEVVLNTVLATWARNERIPDWSPDAYRIHVGDFDGDGLDDVFLQPYSAQDPAYIVNFKANSNPVNWFVSTLPTGAGIDWSVSAGNIIVGDFYPTASGDDIYYQALTAGGSNHIIGVTSLTNNGTVTLDQPPALANLQEPTLDSSGSGGTTNPGSAVGFTPGKFSVLPSGAASYEIPIAVPPGVSGMEPKLSLRYNSQAPNGLLGVGWTLSGMSAISRCPATIAQDNLNDGVDLDSNDRFCLDSARLILKEGTTNEYRTEIDTFQRVRVIAGTLGGNDAEIEIKDKAGLTRYYGKFNGQSDGVVLVQGTTAPITYALKRIEDVKGNYIDFFYVLDTALSSYRPTTIIYGSTGAGVATVTFGYEARQDTRSGYLAGSTTGMDQRLNSIKTYAGTTNVREYVLGYDYSVTTGRSLLASVTECERQTNTCFSSTTFDWQIGSRGFTGAMSGQVGVAPTAQNLQIMDVNNDGRPDFVHTVNGAWEIHTGITNSVTNVAAHGSNFVTLDVDGDGYGDLIQPSSDSFNAVPLQILNGDSSGGPANFTVTATSISATDDNLSTAAGADINGDGREDLIIGDLQAPGVGAGNNVVYLSVGNDFDPNPIPVEIQDTGIQGIVANAFFASGSYFKPIQFDNDGITDLLICRRTEGPWGSSVTWTWQVYSYDPSANSVRLKYDGAPTLGGCDPALLVDANGDGLTDILLDKSVNWKLWINDGTGYSLSWQQAKNSNVTYKVTNDLYQASLVQLDWPNISTTETLNFSDAQVDDAQAMDYDGDGRTDILIEQNGLWYALISDGTGYSAGAVNTGRASTAQASQAYLSDVGGDGFPDIVFPKSDYTGHLVYHRRGAANDLLESVTDGLGAMTRVTYATANDGEVYTGHDDLVDGGATPQAFPIADAGNPVPVVKSYSVDDGQGGYVNTSYLYSGAKVHKQGRGFLGFSQVKSWNDNSELETINQYRQDFPFTGMVHTVVVKSQDMEVAEQPANAPWSYNSNCESNNTYWYCWNWPITQTTTTTVPGPVLRRTTNAYAQKTTGNGAGIVFPYVSQSVETLYPLGDDTQALKITTADYAGYDNYGNVGTVTVTLTDGQGGNAHSTVTTNLYGADDAANWILGRLTQSTVVHTRTAYGDTTTPLQETRTSTFAYYPDGLLWTETVESGTAKSLTKTYTYDAFGNQSVEQVSGADIATRATTTTFDGNGQFPQTVANAVNHTETQYWDARYGVRTALIGPNGLETAWAYDHFGRQVSETLPQTGVSTTTSYDNCAVSGCLSTEAIYRVTVNGADGSQTITEFDKLNREVMRRTLGFDGQEIKVERAYDPLGREYLISAPYRGTENPCWTFRKFDAAGRVVQEWQASPSNDPLNPDSCTKTRADLAFTNPVPTTGGRLKTFTYDQITSATHFAGAGQIETTTTAFGRTTNRVENVMDRVMSVHEMGEVAGQPGLQQIITRYDYDALGNNTWIQDAEGNVTTVSYDVRGFKTSMVDPNMGNWSYGYNVLGELIWQVDANGVRTEQEYDLLGRMVKRTGNAQLPINQQLITDWVYDTAAGAGIGKLHETTGPYLPGGSATTAYRETYHYDSHGRVEHVVRRIDSAYFWTTNYYDSHGRVQKIDYPATSGDATSTVSGSQRFRVEHTYNSYGYLATVASPTSNLTYWQAMNTDAWGNVTRYSTAGSTAITSNRVYDRATGFLLEIMSGSTTDPGLVQDLRYWWDDAGNLTKRADAAFAPTTLEEDFYYDSLHRLQTTQVTSPFTGGNPLQYSNTYSATGKLMSRTSAGVNVTNYQYGNGNAAGAGDAGPHAVVSLTSDGAPASYTYDDNGNMLTGGGGRTVVWTERNKPALISNGAGDSSAFEYGPDGSRYKQVAYTASSQKTVTTLYVGALFEKIDDDAVTPAASEFRHYVFAGGQRIAIHTAWQGGSTERDEFLYIDHLGSITAISDIGATVVDRLSYDPWGKRRDPATWDATGTFLPASLDRLTRGFTDHEHLDQLGLIHMNGRIYDPQIARFLSADPFVQFRHSTQGLDRYAYVANNPLSYNDPSGHFLAALTALFVAAFTTPPGIIITGAVMGYLQSGDIRGAVFGAFASAISLGLGQVFGSFIEQHAILGRFLYASTSGLVFGGLSELQGGDFASGFLGAFSGAVLARWSGNGQLTLKQTLKAAVVGGTVSEIGGGKFANGAAYAAFSYAVAAASTSNELRGSVAQIQDESDLVAPALEEATIDSVYADADRLGIDVPEGHEYSYSSKFAVGTLNANGTVNKGNLRFVDSLSEMAVDEVSFSALTSTKTGSTTYYRGSASPSLVESISTGSNGTTIALVRRNGISNAVFNVGHEVAHARGIRSEIVANRYGQRALQKYQLLNPPRPPGY